MSGESVGSKNFIQDMRKKQRPDDSENTAYVLTLLLWHMDKSINREETYDIVLEIIQDPMGYTEEAIEQMALAAKTTSVKVNENPH